MTCQKCTQPAAIHLTEIVKDKNGQKRAIEVHLCVAHALEQGIVGSAIEQGEPVTGGGSEDLAAEAETAMPTAIVPAGGGSLALARPSTPAPEQPSKCPVCGITWAQFKSSGHMGCPNDYLIFETRIIPLVKRAHEGSTQHAGKVPAVRGAGVPADEPAVQRQVAAVRLQRELQQALDAENYERAARLRDQLRHLGAN